MKILHLKIIFCDVYTLPVLLMYVLDVNINVYFRVLDKTDIASHKADRRSSKSDRPNPKQQLNVDHPKQQEPPRPSAEPPKSEPQVELNTITQVSTSN